MPIWVGECHLYFSSKYSKCASRAFKSSSATFPPAPNRFCTTSGTSCSLAYFLAFASNYLRLGVPFSPYVSAKCCEPVFSPASFFSSIFIISSSLNIFVQNLTGVFYLTLILFIMKERPMLRRRRPNQTYGLTPEGDYDREWGW